VYAPCPHRRVQETLTGAARQRGRIHFMCNPLKSCPQELAIRRRDKGSHELSPSPTSTRRERIPGSSQSSEDRHPRRPHCPTRPRDPLAFTCQPTNYFANAGRVDGRHLPILNSVSTSVLVRHQAFMVYLGAAVMSVAGGMLVARNPAAIALVLIAVIALAGLAVLLSPPPAVVFLGWLALAPIFADSAQASALGRAGIWALYITPAVLLGAITIARARAGTIVSFVDFLPAAYVAYLLGSLAFTSTALQADPLGTSRVVFLTVVLGPLFYYFLTIGPGAALPGEKVLLILIAGAALQGVLALVELATHWNLWGFTVWQEAAGPARAVSTLANPGILGMFLGVGIVLALAVLTWGGPRSLRRLSMLMLIVGVPGLIATLTRGPILATAVAAVFVLVLGHKRLLGVAVIASTVIVIMAVWPSIRATTVYQERGADAETVRVRAGLQDWSLQLAAQKPVFGWGYGSFDRVKNTSGLTAAGGVSIRSLLETTSHNSYLTILVETGVIGLLLYALPFLTLASLAVARVRARSPDGWVIVGTLASLFVIALSGVTLDLRFFSFAQALPWILLAILRGATTTAPISSSQP
jgi:O-antigen ligase